MNIEITAKRLRELLLAERKLGALQGGGVDNWEGYEDSLEYHGYLEFMDEFEDVSDRDLSKHI